MSSAIRVLIVDDSAIVRKILTDCLRDQRGIEVVGTAPDPIVAREKIRVLKPDVVTLDIEMPRMNGISFLKELMQTHPLPVIIISSLAAQGCAAALDATEAGAVEVLAKPGGPYSVGELGLSLAQKIRSAALARVARTHRIRPGHRPPLVAPDPRRRTSGVIAIGASTGGTEAIRAVLAEMPAGMPPVVIVQHIPAVFSRAFADRLNSLCRLEVKEAANGDVVGPGQAVVAPGDLHMIVHRRGGRLEVEVQSGPRVCYQRPAVDVLFHSVARAFGSDAIGVLLTGMGSDGAEGLAAMRRAGARTLAQDEQSCVVYGMPKEAVRVGAVERVLPLDCMAAGICELAGGLGSRRPSADPHPEAVRQ